MGVADSTRDKKMDSPGKQMPGSSIDRQTARQLAEMEMEKQPKREREVSRRRRWRRWSGMAEGTIDGETSREGSESWATGDRQERRQATVS